MVTEFQPAVSLKMCSSFTDVKEFGVKEYVTVGNLLPGSENDAVSWVKKFPHMSKDHFHLQGQAV
jgi:hypothetical protein